MLVNTEQIFDFQIICCPVVLFLLENEGHVNDEFTQQFIILEGGKFFEGVLGLADCAIGRHGVGIFWVTRQLKAQF